MDISIKCFLLLCFCFSLNCGADVSHIEVQENPGCNSTTADCTKPWLITVMDNMSANVNGTQYLHLWGAVGAPTIITAQLASNASLAVDWDGLTASAADVVTITPEPVNVFGVAITELILFDDPSDTGTIDNIPSDAQLSVNTSLFDWDYSVVTNNDTVQVTMTTVRFNGTQLANDTGLVIKLTNSIASGRPSAHPRLLATSSATTVDLVLDSLLLNMSNPHPSKGPVKTHNHKVVAPISGFTAPRWAVRLALFSSEQRAGGELQHTVSRSLDDEYAPAVFQLDDITSPRARSSPTEGEEGGFLQWRPICYLTPKRDFDKATLPNLVRPSNLTDGGEEVILEASEDQYVLLPLASVSDSLRQSLAYAMFGDNLTEVLSAETLVSFGQPSDGYYSTYNYTVWTWTVGSGTPPTEKLSFGVLSVILVGLGLPVLVMLLAGITLGVNKLVVRRRSDRLLYEVEEEDGEAE